MLSQADSEGRERAIAYGGRSLRGAEFKWDVSERECLALVEGIKQFHPYLASNHFIVYTDHIALKWLQSIKESTGRLARWSMKLQAYNFTICHKALHIRRLNSFTKIKIQFRVFLLRMLQRNNQCTQHLKRRMT